MLVVLGLLLSAAGLVLLLNVGGAADAVIRRVTSRKLGDLAPGFAASRGGFNVYATLVLAVGLFTLGLGVIGLDIPIGTSLIVLGGISFAGASVIAIAGEIETYRALKR
ncbi:MAG TPA: hypothetical protein VF383_03325 [Candidatus Dormibacteraeota bacterium]